MQPSGTTVSSRIYKMGVGAYCGATFSLAHMFIRHRPVIFSVMEQYTATCYRACCHKNTTSKETLVTKNVKQGVKISVIISG